MTPSTLDQLTAVIGKNKFLAFTWDETPTKAEDIAVSSTDWEFFAAMAEVDLDIVVNLGQL